MIPNLAYILAIIRELEKCQCLDGPQETGAVGPVVVQAPLGPPGRQSTVGISGRKASGSSGNKDSAPHWGLTAWLARAGRLVSVDISREGEMGHLCCPLPDLCSVDTQGGGFGAPSPACLAAVESWICAGLPFSEHLPQPWTKPLAPPVPTWELS